MTTEDKVLVTTRQEAHLCAIGLALSVVSPIVFTAGILLSWALREPNGQGPGTAIVVVMAALAFLVGQVLLAMLWSVRSQRRPDLFPPLKVRFFRISRVENWLEARYFRSGRLAIRFLRHNGSGS